MALFNDTQVIQKIKTTPMAPAGCHTHRHASRDSYYKNMINLIHHIYHSSHPSGHITSQHALQKQVRRPLLCCCKFYVAATGF